MGTERLSNLMAKRFEGGCLWGMVGLIIGGAVIAGIVMLATLNRTANTGIALVPDFTVIPRNTDTPILVQATDQSTEIPAETQIPFENIVYHHGELVEVYGTGGDGLRLRNAPNLEGIVNILALENEVYEVRGGPIDADGYTWWFLINPYDNEVQGWSVANFLRGANP